MNEPTPLTFVFEDCEVRLTGRRATKQLKSGKVDEVVEITPVSNITGTWKRWVRREELFAVHQ